MNNQPAGLACVTGASSGIGQAYARLLASQGFDLILVARRAEVLRCLAEELAAAYGIRAGVLPLDLTLGESVTRLAQRLQAEDSLQVLVNSAGYGAAAWFSSSSLPEQMGMLDLHVTAPVALAHAALAPMLRAGHGSIINVSSLVAFFQVPTVAVYAASKRFMVDFSQSLGMEVRKKGVRVQALCPGLTSTGLYDRLAFNARIFPAFAWLRSDQVAAASWKAVQRRSGVCIPGALNRAVYTLTRFIPSCLQRSLLMLLEPLLIPFLNQPEAAA